MLYTRKNRVYLKINNEQETMNNILVVIKHKIKNSSTSSRIQ